MPNDDDNDDDNTVIIKCILICMFHVKKPDRNNI